MKVKAILFASGAMISIGAPAGAADLSVVEPSEYVRVCDAFGAGYWYIPGSDTCIKIGGYVRFDVRYREAPIVTGDHSANWDFRTRARLNIWATSQTDLGVLTGFMRLQGNYDPSSSSDKLVALDRAWLSLGHLMAGYDSSTFDYAAGYTLDTGGFRSDTPTQQVRITQKFDNFGFQAAVEDPRYRNVVDDWNQPDLVGAFTYANGPFDMKLSGAFVDQWTTDHGYAVALGASMKLDHIAKGDAIRFIAGFAQDAGSYTSALATLGSAYGGGTSWNLMASAQHFWAPNFSTAGTGSYVHGDNGTPNHAWQAAFSAAYVPVKNLTVGGEFNYVYNTTKSDPDTWTALFRLVRDIQ